GPGGGPARRRPRHPEDRSGTAHRLSAAPADRRQDLSGIRRTRRRAAQDLAHRPDRRRPGRPRGQGRRPAETLIMSPEPVGSRQQAFSGFTPLHEEYDYLLDEVAGAVPEQLRGTVYRNGPGRLEAGGQPLGHLFDGDGMLSMFRFADGRVRFRNRYVRTRHDRRSRHTRGAPFRGLGTRRPGGVLANALRFPVNVANTAVIMHAGTLLALWEAGRPTEIDPDSLDTVGEYDYDGELRWLG